MILAVMDLTNLDVNKATFLLERIEYKDVADAVHFFYERTQDNRNLIIHPFYYSNGYQSPTDI